MDDERFVLTEEMKTGDVGKDSIIVDDRFAITAGVTIGEEEVAEKEEEVEKEGAVDWAAFEARALKRGVIYLSRIPPFMSVHTIRKIFSDFGEIGRVYLTPEDAATARTRRKFKGCTRKKYVDGWIEFAKKSIARRVAETLNNTALGGKKRSYYHDDIWNIRYLKGFKWHHLTEKLAYENAVRSQKLRNELSAAKKEHDFVSDKQQQSNVIQNIQKRQKRRRDGDDQATAAPEPKILRHFKQRQAIVRPESL